MRMFDFLLAELVGSAKFKTTSQDLQLPCLPSNVNNDQLYPGMPTFSVESEGVTDLCSARFIANLVTSG